jgi:hypothetical protein
MMTVMGSYARDVSRNEFTSADIAAEDWRAERIREVLYTYEIKFDLAKRESAARIKALESLPGQVWGQELRNAKKKEAAKLEGTRTRLCAQRTRELTQVEERFRSKKEAAITRRNAARAARVAIWNQFYSTGNEEEALAGFRALHASKSKSVSTHPTQAHATSQRKTVRSLVGTLLTKLLTKKGHTNA